MSGAMRKIGEYLGLLEDTGHYDDYDGDTETTTHDAVDQPDLVRALGARSASAPPTGCAVQAPLARANSPPRAPCG